MQTKNLLDNEKQRLRETSRTSNTIAADCFFIEKFITFEMEIDFYTIIRDFFANNSDVSIYSNGSWAEFDEAKYSCFEYALKIRLLNIIFNAYRGGNAYAKVLFQYLYKTYYKYEYNQIKRFRKITYDEIISIAEADFGDGIQFSVSRLLTICEIFDIEIEEKCNQLYSMLLEYKIKRENERKKKNIIIPEHIYNESKLVIEELKNTQNSNNLTDTFKREEEFMKFVLSWKGYPDGYLYKIIDYFEGYDEILVRTLTLLKIKFPNIKFSLEQIQKYSQLMLSIESIIRLSNIMDEETRQLLGTSNGTCNNSNIRFNLSEKMKYTYQKKEDPKNKHDITEEKNVYIKSEDNNTLPCLCGELTVLQEKIHKQEQEIRYLRNTVQEMKKRDKYWKKILPNIRVIKRNY